MPLTRRLSLCMIVPTKGRPRNASRLLHAANETAGEELELLAFAIDHNEPMIAEYQDVIPRDDEHASWSWAEVTAVHAQPQRAGPVLNQVAADRARSCDYVGFMGDDHLPRTRWWDEELIAALNGRPGVAYGNDGNQGDKLPTACVISADIVRALGYMCPPVLEHLYLDDFWKTLGESVGNLAYCPDVVIEHMHPTVGKAPDDEHYRRNNDLGQYSRDELAYQQFLAGPWPADLGKLKRGLGL